MKLAMSEIAWQESEMPKALDIMKKHGFSGLEIVPPRVAGPTPYQHVGKAAAYAANVWRSHGIAICSMQSIWYGQAGNMFGDEAKALLAYTKAAVLFAKAAGCQSMVFGCPKNRQLPVGVPPKAALPFFSQAARFAQQHGRVISLEANPAIYGTNFINHTAEAFAMAQEVNSPGFMVNLDVGTMIANGEDAATICGHVGEVNHVHISQPHLALIEKLPLHRELAAILKKENYRGYISVEMKEQSLKDIEKTLCYVAEVFL